MRTRTGRTWKGGTVLSAALLSILVLVGLLVGANEAQSNSNNDGSKGGECPGEVHYFAKDAPPQSNFFGPAAESGTVEELLVEHHQRRCLDPAEVVGDAIAAELPGFTGLNGDGQITAKIREVRDDPELWRDTIAELEKGETLENAEVTTISGSYQTLYMVVREGKVPLIRQAAPDRPEFDVLRFTLPDGSVRNYKLDCGFQPVDQEFPGVPPLKPPVQPPVKQPVQPRQPQPPPPTITTTAKPPLLGPDGEQPCPGHDACQTAEDPGRTEGAPKEEPPPKPAPPPEGSEEEEAIEQHDPPKEPEPEVEDDPPTQGTTPPPPP